jgi:hypothetical protein
MGDEARLVALLDELGEGRIEGNGMLAFTTSIAVMSRRRPVRSTSRSMRRISAPSPLRGAERCA